MRRACPGVLVPLALTLGLGAGACATPPEREIRLAEAAIASAQEAHADVIAPAEFAAAVVFLDQSRDAVALGDYRLALSRALDAREQAEVARRQAEERRVVIARDVEMTLVTIQAVRDQATANLSDARTSPSSYPGLADLEATLATADRAVQEARSALARGEPVTARDQLVGVLEQLREAVDALAVMAPVSS